MRRVLVFALICSFGHGSVAFASGPLLESARRAAQELVASRSESPNAAKARRVATELGLGRHVAVKLISGSTLRGHLHAINDDHFVLLRDRGAGSAEIAYDEVQKLGPNLSTPAKAVIWAVAVAAVSVWAYKEFSETRGTRD